MSFTYFLKRAAFAALALAALMTSAFFLVRLTGDPVNLYLPVDASDAAREAMRVRSIAPSRGNSSIGPGTC